LAQGEVDSVGESREPQFISLSAISAPDRAAPIRYTRIAVDWAGSIGSTGREAYRGIFMRSHADRTMLGTGLAFLAFAVLATADAVTKFLSARYSVFEVATIDAIFALLTSLPVLALWEGVGSLRARRPGIVMLRCTLGAGSLMLAFLAFSLIPLADAYTIAFLTPLVVTALSAPLLGERVGWRQWVAVVIGFVAVVLMLRPDFNTIGPNGAAPYGSGWGQLAILASGLLFALSMLMLRRIAKTESSGALLLVYFIMLFVISLPFTIADWRMPSAFDFGLMAATGTCSGLGNLLLILAFRYAAAALVSSFMYSQLIWGTAFGYLLFMELPDAITLGGAVVLMLCGLYTLMQAAKAARSEAAIPAAFD
jgi:drug/metabolite transporter (DMT)-like permease